MRNRLYYLLILILMPTGLKGMEAVLPNSTTFCRTAVFIESQKPGYQLLRGLFAHANPRGVVQSEAQIEADNRFFLDVISSPQAKHFIFLHG
ncbi:MAG: hypothetical protein KDD39_10565, partial [Bdellovibrionales bacterium]|nr:hypothetical protein [Bdellovibrionales bacterium]